MKENTYSIEDKKFIYDKVKEIIQKETDNRIKKGKAQVAISEEQRAIIKQANKTLDEITKENVDNISDSFARLRGLIYRMNDPDQYLRICQRKLKEQNLPETKLTEIYNEIYYIYYRLNQIGRAHV